MQKKIRLTRTTIVEYAPNTECYPDNLTIEDMAKMDIFSITEDEVDMKLIFFNEIVSDKVTFEIVERDK
jgi:hypothetical protein